MKQLTQPSFSAIRYWQTRPKKNGSPRSAGLIRKSCVRNWVTARSAATIFANMQLHFTTNRPSIPLMDGTALHWHASSEPQSARTNQWRNASMCPPWPLATDSSQSCVAGTESKAANQEQLVISASPPYLAINKRERHTHAFAIWWPRLIATMSGAYPL